jgi:pimeloyl-ACP methyl ester carboxylesterase
VRPRVPLPDPLSQAMIPLLHGLMRKLVLRMGATMECYTLQEIRSNCYYLPARAQAGQLPVVLLHGIADNALTWGFMLPGLRSIGPLYALDLPGFGQSGYPQGRRYSPIDEQVAVVRQLVREQIGRPALLIGNSMGGWVAARLAQLDPELVRGAVLLNPGGAALEGRASWEPFLKTVAVGDLKIVRAVYRQMFGRVNPALYLGQLGFQTLFRRDPVAHFVAAANEDAFFSPAELRELRVPIGLVWGMADHFLPSGSYEFFHDNLPGAALLSLPGCGHLPQQERPRQVARFVRQFVKERIG